VRVIQRRWRKCRHCEHGFYTREFVEDKENNTSNAEPTNINPLFTREFLPAPIVSNPYIQGSES
jgi:hypothetical protein